MSFVGCDRAFGGASAAGAIFGVAPVEAISSQRSAFSQNILQSELSADS
jgi:hypothetical protein